MTTLRTMMWLSLLLFSVPALGMMVARCPEGWEHRPDTYECYLVHSHGSQRSHSDASVYCQAHGGELAYIDSSSLRDWLGQLIAATGDVGQNGYFWVGAENQGGSWVWVETGAAVDTDIVPWEDGSSEGDCAAFTTNSRLIQQDCVVQLKFICHRLITTPPPCEDQGGWDQMHQYCYKQSEWSTSWHDALVECTIEGGSLLSIVAEYEQQLALDMAVDVHDQVWLGLTEEGHPGDFQWTDGSPLNYTNWQDGQPDTTMDGFGSAVVDHENADGKWIVELVTDDFHYMCKKEQGACLPGWEVFEDSCYYFNTEQDDSVVWDDAKTHCEDVGAKMVVLDTPEEDLFFRNRVLESDTVWIGLHSEPGDADLYWEDGTTMNSKNFTYMTDENINDALSHDDNQCVFFQVVDPGDSTLTSSWVPTDCNLPRHYACEVPAGQSVTFPPPDAARYCPEGWEVLEGYCYQFNAEEMSWMDASKACSRVHSTADLVSIVTWAEQDFVHNRLGGGWIGLNDRHAADQWVWSDGAALTITNWNAGEPNGDTESCVEMLVSTGTWNDFFCSEAKTYACKMKASTSPIGPVTTTTAMPDSSVCGHGWTEDPLSGQCYRLEMEELTFDDAHDHCRHLSYDAADETRPSLLSIYDSQEQSFILSMVMAQHLSQSSLWIGMKNTIDGDIWVDDSPVSYFNWNDGEPSGGGWSEECVEMYTSTGKWNDAYCSNRLAFICEKKGRNYVGPQLPPPPQVDCPSGWSYYDNHCYYFSPDVVDWDTANSWCQANLGSQLASVTHQGENDFLYQRLNSQYVVAAWLGLHDDNNGDNWHWVDGAASSYTNWGPDEPNNANNNEHCGEMRAYDYYFNGAWNDQDCSLNINFVCKISVTTCPQTWTYKDGKCYYASDYAVSFSEAEQRCRDINAEAELVSLHSEQENSDFADIMSHTLGSTWIGLTYDENTANWSWTDDSPVNYVNWNTDEPNMLSTEHCGEMIDYPGDASYGKWNNLDCDNTKPFGCELFPTHTVGCEDGWTQFESYCYITGESAYYTFSEARTVCQDLGADLATVHTAEENDFIYSLMGYYYTYMWLGMTDEGHPYSMQWVDNSEVTFTKWDTLTYNPFYAYPMCASYTSYSGTYMGLWALEDCQIGNNYVCKKPIEAVAITRPTDECPQGGEPYKGSCYIFAEDGMDWSGAEASCEAQNAHLIVINDRYESAFISAYLGDLGSRVWLGMTGTVNGDGSVTFSWVNGEPVEYTNWDEYEPAPDHGTCVAASGEQTNPGLWSVRGCDDVFRYICEYDREGYTPPTPPTTKAPTDWCLPGWTKGLGNCYKVFPNASTWGEGEEYCLGYGGHLVSIEDLGEEAMVQGLPGMSDLPFDYVWVGLAKGENEGYEWTDGSPYSYVHWDVNEPDSNHGRENCIRASRSSMMLSNAVCDSHLPYICEGDQGTMVTPVVPPTPPNLITCSDNDKWYLFEGYCYLFVSESDAQPETWSAAQMACRHEGGNLASIHTNDENYWIESVIYGRSDSYMWLGGNSYLGSGYQWVDDSPFDYTNWAPGEPNDIFYQEDCLSMFTRDQGYWNDLNCASQLGFVCKRPLGVTHPPPTTSQVPDGHCPQGWVHAGTKCLQLNKEPKTFENARSACQQQGPNVDLASIHSELGQAYLSAALGTTGEDMWVGMLYVDSFMWVDQTSVTYTNWAVGEPNGNGQERCVEVYYTNGMWNDIDCNLEHGYVCMMTQDPSLATHQPMPACPAPYDSYVPYNGACYRLDATQKTWQDAEDTCVAEGAHLVSMLGYTEGSFIWALTQGAGISPDTWTGLNNKEDWYVFKWSDGWPAVYTNWGPGQPLEDQHTHRCVTLNTTTGLWANQVCNTTHSFVCKYSNGSVPTPDPPTDGNCPDQRWHDLGGSYCYLVVEEPTLTWDEANTNCLHEEGALASIHSDQERRLLTMLTIGIPSPLWIGLVQTENGFRWSDGTGMDFTYWAKDEPNNIEEQCGEVISNNGQWNDAVCSNTKPYICKTKKALEGTQTNPPPPPSSPRPGSPNDKMGGGAITGIVLACLFLVAVVSIVGYSYMNKPKKVSPNNQSFDNTHHNPDKGSIESGTVRMKGVEAAGTDA